MTHLIAAALSLLSIALVPASGPVPWWRWVAWALCFGVALFVGWA